MKKMRLAAALIAAFTAIAPLTNNSKINVPCTAYAENGSSADSLSWIPKDFDSALKFRNTYGAVHIEDGVLCVVFRQEYEPLDPVNYVHNLRYEYTLPRNNNTVSIDDSKSYTQSDTPEKGDTEFIVFTISAFATGKFEIGLVDSYVDSPIPDQHFTFEVNDEFNIIETDIYSWLPDCENEYWEFSKRNSNLSVKDNYVVFCLSHSAGTGNGWELNDEGKKCFELDTVSDCSLLSSEPVDGGEINKIYTYKAVKDGHDKISYNYKSAQPDDEEGRKSLVADCAIIDNTQTILLSGNIRASIVDYDTGEKIPLPEDKTPSIWTNISDGTKSTGPILAIESNPAIVSDDLGNFFDSTVFSFGLDDRDLPDGYSFIDDEMRPGYYNGNIHPENCMTVTQYENGSADVVFKLKRIVTGDANDDGEFNISDVVLLQKWLIAVPDTEIKDWEAANFCNDDVLDVFDLCLMKEKLLRKNAEAYVKPDREMIYGADILVIEDNLPMYLGPDTSYNIVKTIPQMTLLTELGIQNNNNNWAFVEYEGQYGWIQMISDEGKEQFMINLPVAAKPVIYLYPEKKTDVHVEFELTESELSSTYPKYNNGWDVTASPDGSLLNKSDGSHHRYLFWDAVNCRTSFDFSKGFCVAGSDTESFLKEKLTYMGLNEEEMNEFIVYWLPLMEHNNYNLISFQDDVYTNSAKLNITPTPDSTLRIFMTYVPMDDAIDIEPQQLTAFERKGFTVVEWGGSKIR